MIRRVLRKLKCIIAPSTQDLALRRWRSDQGDATLRQEYPLSESSVVLDLGGFRGQWASDIFSRYRCEVFVFEPVQSFFEFIEKRFKANPKVKAFKFGLGGKTRQEEIYINADGSSVIRAAKEKASIEIVDIDTWLFDNKIEAIDLIKINIEGGEYELLERMIEKNITLKVRNLQIQFHDFFPDAGARMNTIRSKLSKTHRQTYCYEFIWENWERIS